VLLTDPSVQAMNWEQWLFEAEAIRKKEYAALDIQMQMTHAVVKGLRHSIISLLGLDVLDDGQDPENPTIVPLALLTAHPEVLNVIRESAQKAQGEKKASQDESFELLSSQLHEQLKTGKSQLPPDMVPFLTEEQIQFDQNSYWNSVDVQEQLKLMGIGPRDSDAPVVEITSKPATGAGPAEPEVDPAELARFEEALKGQS